MNELVISLIRDIVVSSAGKIFQKISNEDIEFRIQKIFVKLEEFFKKKYPTLNVSNSFLAREENITNLCKWIIENNIFNSECPRLNLYNYDESVASQEQETFVIEFIKRAVMDDEVLKQEMHFNITLDNNEILRALRESMASISESYMDDYQPQRIRMSMEKLNNSYVETQQYKNAIGILKQNNSIILVGCSGIGKTDTSIMLAQNFMKKGYDFRYVSSPKENDLKNIWYLINKDIEKKEILIFDDFLGNTQLGSSSYLSALEEILKNMEDLDKKKFIFSSRKAILDSLKAKNKKVDSLLRSCVEEIDLEIWTNIEDKLKIFVMYSRKNNILDNISNLIQEKIWDENTIKKFLEKHSYTPFIIKMAIRECSKLKKIEYENIILNFLEHPDDIWEREIVTLDDASRDYIYMLFSLSESSVERKIVDECFIHYLKEIGKLPKLSLSDIYKCIEVFVHFDNNRIEFIHPSLIDYLDKKISLQVKENILNSATYLEQIEKIDVNKKYIRELLRINVNSELPMFFKLKVLPITYVLQNNMPISFTNNILMQYLKYIYEFKIEDLVHEPIVIYAVNQVLSSGLGSLFVNSSFIYNILKLNYDFSEILSDTACVRTLFQYSNGDNIWDLIQLTTDKENDVYNYLKIDNFKQVHIQRVLQEIIEDELVCWIEENVVVYIKDELETYSKDEEIYIDEIAEVVLERMLEEYDFEKSRESLNMVINKHEISNIDTQSIYIEDYSFINDVIDTAIHKYLNLN